MPDIAERAFENAIVNMLVTGSTEPTFTERVAEKAPR